MEYRRDDLLFLKERIKEINVALFKAESDSVLQLPNNIISTLRVDDDGYVWFFRSCTGPYAQHLDKNCSLHSIIIRYYQKGNNCLQISGKAFVENADEALLNARLVEKNVLNKIVLLKVKILKAEYFKAKSSAKI